MEGKVVAVTGCTSGTGFACAKACAELGATVVLLNRASERATAAEEKLRNAASGIKVVTVPLNLSSFQSVRDAAAKLRADFGEMGIDVLCCNAGVMASADLATEDGCDVQMQTNHLSHFLLMSEIWPLLETAANQRGEARVVTHASISAKGPPLESKYFGKNGGNLGGDKNGMAPFSGPRWDRYHQTKLANLACMYALHDRCQKAGSKVKALCAHPGVASTELQVKTVAGKGMSGGVANMTVSQTAEDGAVGITLCCCSPGVKSGDFYGPPGQGMAGMAVSLPVWRNTDEVARNMLWEESERTTGASFKF
jgi:NAD(P)-dependent dehydrogenase (short-subunit alcohol dehydrogenase family)